MQLKDVDKRDKIYPQRIAFLVERLANRFLHFLNGAYLHARGNQRPGHPWAKHPHPTGVFGCPEKSNLSLVHGKA